MKHCILHPGTFQSTKCRCSDDILVQSFVIASHTGNLLPILLLALEWSLQSIAINTSMAKVIEPSLLAGGHLGQDMGRFSANLVYAPSVRCTKCGWHSSRWQTGVNQPYKICPVCQGLSLLPKNRADTKGEEHKFQKLDTSTAKGTCHGAPHTSLQPSSVSPST